MERTRTAAPGGLPRRTAGGPFYPLRLLLSVHFFAFVSLFCSGAAADQIFSASVGSKLRRISISSGAPFLDISDRFPPALLIMYAVRSFTTLAPVGASRSHGSALLCSARMQSFIPLNVLQDNRQESMVMTNKKGQKYFCYLPVVETKSLKPIIQQNSSNVIVEGDKRIKLRTPDELMEGLKELCFYRRTQEFILGEFDPEATAVFNQNHSEISTLKDPRSKDASQRYHAHLFTNGTACDLTDQPREAEIRFVCSESAVQISSIKEVSTCKYAVTVQCPYICRHP
ncbi:hypothetical protein Taro_025044 [Colocasia esculenta]|uniref:MRH domain-containing protein n=1 Tax=Colocasia esculenta TaxID=4460 RepID=A0A843V952_COLES|nr:hypothetical protein [Colocasia esculenta]